MNAPVLWIILPAIIAFALFFFRSFRDVIVFIGAAVSLWLAWVAWTVQFGEPIIIGKVSLRITETFSVLGREFVLSDAERPFVAFLYLVNAMWLLGAYFSRPSTVFTSFAMITVSLFTAAISVEPFLYAALLIETLVLISIPFLAPPGQKLRHGALRFLAFQTIGMPFILFTGWMLAGVEATPGNIGLVFRAGILIAAGFAFLLPIFPFHSWIPMVAEESHPYVVAFILFMFTSVVSLFGLGFLERFSWLRESEILLLLLISIGLVMVVLGGIRAALEDHLGRTLGYAAVMEIGWSMLAIRLAANNGIMLYFWLMVSRAISFVTWAVALSRLRREADGDIHISTVKGYGHRFPFSVFGLLIAQLSLAGLPLLPGFPVRLVLWQTLAGVYPLVAILSVIGSIGLMINALRAMLILYDKDEKEEQGEKGSYFGAWNKPNSSDQEKRSGMVLSWSIFTIYLAVILFIGLLPQRLFHMLELLAGMFPQFGG